MEKATALELRNSLGKILKKLNKTSQPIVIERNSKPAAVLISLEDYKKRFVDKEADDKRKLMIQEILNNQLELPKNKTSLDLIREIRK